MPEDDSAESIIRAATRAAFTSGAVPAAGEDIDGVLEARTGMIGRLAALHGVPSAPALARNLAQAASTGGGLQATLSALKGVPGLGILIGQTGQPLLSAAVTASLGNVVEAHFAAGGTLADFNIQAARSAVTAGLPDIMATLRGGETGSGPQP